MGATFGIFRRNDAHLTERQWRALRDATALPLHCFEEPFREQGAVLGGIGDDGKFVLASGSKSASAASPFIAMANAAICNRGELIAGLGESKGIADAALMRAAYERWGEPSRQKLLATGRLPPGTRRSAGCFWRATILETPRSIITQTWICSSFRPRGAFCSI